MASDLIDSDEKLAELRSESFKGLRPRDDAVLCPACAHRFQAVPEDVQREVAELREALRVVEEETRDGGQWGLADVNDYVRRVKGRL